MSLRKIEKNYKFYCICPFSVKILFILSCSFRWIIFAAVYLVATVEVADLKMYGVWMTCMTLLGKSFRSKFLVYFKSLIVHIAYWLALHRLHLVKTVFFIFGCMGLVFLFCRLHVQNFSVLKGIVPFVQNDKKSIWTKRLTQSLFFIAFFTE